MHPGTAGHCKELFFFLCSKQTSLEASLKDTVIYIPVAGNQTVGNETHLGLFILLTGFAVAG